MKRILVIQGGGRPNGNTAQLIAAFVKGTESAGHQTEMISLLKNEVKDCLGCNACRYGKPCVQKDAFNEMIPKIKAADLVVFASPLYYFTFSARLKAFIDRFYCMAEECEPSLGRYESYPVKDSALLMTAADNYFWTFEQAVSYYQFSLVNYIGFHDRGRKPLRQPFTAPQGTAPGYMTFGKIPDCEEYKRLRRQNPGRNHKREDSGRIPAYDKRRVSPDHPDG